MRTIKALVIAAITVTILIFVARFVYPLPSFEGRKPSQALPISINTTMGNAILNEMADHVGKSGMIPLLSGEDAFAARILLAEAAVESLDVQYYIWQNDLTGFLLLDALRKAAERGVRVRLLLDDNGTPFLDQELLALNESPNFEVRYFNPFVLRKPRTLSLLFDFPRLNRRMHNKSFTVDGAVTIVGGRNIGDIYFNSNEDVNYFDFDVLAAGLAATDVANDFDGYWASGSAYPADSLITKEADGLALLAANVEKFRALPRAAEYRTALGKTSFLADVMGTSGRAEWVTMTLVSDDPLKGLGPVASDQLMIVRLAQIIGEVKSSFDLVSAYFVPGDQFTKILTGYARNGVNVRTVTNSQESTDVVTVHSGYVKYRDELLAAGIEVFEMAANPADIGPKDRLGILGSSSSSLHAKTFAIDRDRIFVGSFNFDPRSANLNSEMGFLVESPRMAAAMSDAIGQIGQNGSYQAVLTPSGAIEWIEQQPDGSTRRHPKEPNTTVLSRLYVRMLGWLPIMWML